MNEKKDVNNDVETRVAGQFKTKDRIKISAFSETYKHVST